VYYLSLEFLIGRLFNDVLGNLGLDAVVNAALGDLGVDLVRLRAAEPDAALGNGGLGRLAACFMESMASLGIPAYGYGIRYDHGAALSEQSRAEAISKVLYPSDETPAGRELRLRQEYFFVSASLQDLVQRHMRSDGDIHFLPERAAIQLNDTHPSIAVAELMR